MAMARSVLSNAGPHSGPRRGNCLQARPGAPVSSQAAGACQCALNHREEELLGCLDEGLLYKEIEERLHLSHTALRKRQHRLYVKLRAQNRTEAVNRWREKRLGETNPAIPHRARGGYGVKEEQGVAVSRVRAKAHGQ
jgi:DNA-binding NarL/FixJ family response regulator